MLERKEVIEKLKNYNRNCSILKELKKKLITLEDIRNEYEINLTSQYGINNDIKSKNKVSDKVASAVIQKEKQNEDIETKITTLQNKIKERENEKDFVETFVSALKKSDREIIVAVYVEGIPINQVIKDVYFKMYDRTCEPKTINARLGKPIDDLIKIYNKELG